MVNIDTLLRLMFEKGASDLHITVGVPPMLRIDGEITPTEFEKLRPEDCQHIIYSILTDEQKEKFERENELDISFGVEGIGRVRMNVYKQRGAIAAALRNIPLHIMSFDELGLPKVVNDIVKTPKGLILVTGPTGSGKSTTLASMIDWINTHESSHIITIEDPIEYIHTHKNCIVNQREVGTDTQSFAQALKYVLRQDPDVILIGEMRDLETIQAALTIAETGHLVFGTLHTPDAVQAINRIIDVFPAHQQSQVRAQISFVLQAVIAQQLLPKAYSSGRVLATEILISNAAVKNLIREEKVHQIYSIMQTGTEYGMRTMNYSLAELYQKQLVTYNEIFARTTDPKDLQRMLQTSNII
ncbi:MAG: type IV pilus twitching motility protein PilT [Candidatus Goldbacteria bacterium]|nr:type IV pilus twitching motility protein PilT [Candidatus Goldiibacteriota bacterium]